METTFEDVCVCVRWEEPSAVKMPSHWHEQSLWEHGFNRCSSVLLRLDKLVLAFHEMGVQRRVFQKACLPDSVYSVGNGSAHATPLCCGILRARWLGALC